MQPRMDTGMGKRQGILFGVESEEVMQTLEAGMRYG
jgi:hypothetical protein